jgi:hypothetical protein
MEEILILADNYQLNKFRVFLIENSGKIALAVSASSTLEDTIQGDTLGFSSPFDLMDFSKRHILLDGR